VKIINKSDRFRYSVLADRNMNPGAKSADIDIGGFSTVLSDVISGCGKAFCIRLNDNERNLINKLLDLDKASYEIDYSAFKKQPTAFETLLHRESEEKAAKIAYIKEARSREEAITNETTYASRKDIDAAKAKSLSLKGEIPAKKFEKKSDEPVSLSDLIGDNKFIEESMKHSNIKTTVASEEGWDMDKINAPKASEALEEKAEQSKENNIAEENPVKKTSRRRRKESK
jgi:hypothetical protein